MTSAADTPDAPATAYDWEWFLASARRHRRTILAANVIALLAAAAAVPIPLLMPLLVDEVLLDQPGAMVALIGGLFPDGWHGPVLYILFTLVVAGFLRFAALALQVWQTREFTRVSKDITYRMRADLLARLGRISMAEYETLGAGAVTSHFVTDVNAVDEFAGATISKFIVAVLTLLGAAVVLFWMHWQLALFICLLNPLVVYLTIVMGRRVKELKRRENSAFELFQEALSETLDAIQQVRAANRERHYLARVIDRARGIKTHSIAYTWRSDAAQRLAFAVFVFGFEIFRALSMFMVVYSDLSIGQMTAVFGYLWFMMTPLQEVLSIQLSYFSATAALGRINRLLTLREEPQYPHLEHPFRDRQGVAISVRGVTFAYGDGPLVLDGVNLEIAAGEKIALVGASGGGKSTLVQVILGLYTPQSGEILFDGVPTTRIGLDVVREHVATVLQHPALFNDTVRMNLSLGREATEEALWRALEVAQLAETVREMPAGLDTLVGRQGVRLSGGQRQRIAIARMVLADPSVVILDEATSALDAETEARVHAGLRKFLAGRTTLIVAHRLSAVRQADRAYVFDGGRIIEQGRHEDLVEGDGLYSRLYGALQ